MRLANADIHDFLQLPLTAHFDCRRRTNPVLIAPMEKTIQIVAALILRADGTALVVRKRGTSAFMQAGGKIEPGETPQAALVRELAEELELNVAADALVAMGQFEAPAANEPGHKVVADVFRINLDHRPIEASAEIEEIRWISPTNPGDIMLAALTRDEIFPAFLAGAAGVSAS